MRSKFEINRQIPGVCRVVALAPRVDQPPLKVRCRGVDHPIIFSISKSVCKIKARGAGG